MVSLLQQEDTAAFTYLYDNYSGALYAVILNIIPDRELAADVLQEVFVNIYRKFSSYDPAKSRLYTWMMNIARNGAIDMLRSKGYRNAQQNREVTEGVHEMAGASFQHIDAIGLRKLLEQLKTEHRELIELAYFKGYTQDEISQMLNIPLGTVKTRTRAALIHMRQIMTEKTS